MTHRNCVLNWRNFCEFSASCSRKVTQDFVEVSVLKKTEILILVNYSQIGNMSYRL